MLNKLIKSISICLLALLITGANHTGKAQIVSPDKNFGFVPGSDNNLFNYEELIEYLKKLDIASERMKMIEIGKSPMGRSMYCAFISTENNIKNLDNLKAINKKLALDAGLSDSERSSLVKNGKVFFLATLSEHSTEVAPSQALPLIAYDLVTTKDPQKLLWLDNVVYMVVPNHNPDGMDMVVEHYKKYRGTKYDGCSLPGVYHKYVGHDNNRDFVTLTQSDSRAISALYDLDWFPQVMIEKHQMGSNGPRYFVPPVHDPIAENVDAGLYNWTWIFGSNMITDATKDGLSGVCQHYNFDDYWPGSTQTCIWKGVIGMLTEAASVKYATPVYIEPTELRVGGKGLSEYKKSINMPLPWEGGWWRLGDIVKLELSSTMSIIKTSSQNREDILKFRNDVSKRETEKGKNQAPFYYVFPSDQHDASEMADLVNLLRLHGIEVYTISKSFTFDNINFTKGDIAVPLAQPFRGFIKEILEKQKYPERHYTPNGDLINPYDITTWSLPLHRGVKSIEVNSRSKELEANLQLINGNYSPFDGKIPGDCKAMIFTSKNNESFKAAFMALQSGMKVERIEKTGTIEGKEIAAGSFILYPDSKTDELVKNLKTIPLFVNQKPNLTVRSLTMSRVALVESWFSDMDAGWTRFVFDSYGIPFQVIRPGEFEKTDFVKNFDIVIFPDKDKEILMSGKPKSESGQYSIPNYPPEYIKGIGKKGMEALMKFFDNGGIILSWGASTKLFLETLNIPVDKGEPEDFQLPVRDISDGLKKGGLECPGSLIKVLLKQDHPLTYGMPSEVGVFFRGAPVFSTSIPNFDIDRRVIAKFPEEEILMSGYCANSDKLANNSAMVWLKKGKGQIVLLGFNPQFRASTQVTFKLIFNTILLNKLDK